MKASLVRIPEKLSRETLSRELPKWLKTGLDTGSRMVLCAAERQVLGTSTLGVSPEWTQDIWDMDYSPAGIGGISLSPHHLLVVAEGGKGLPYLSFQVSRGCLAWMVSRARQYRVQIETRRNGRDAIFAGPRGAVLEFRTPGGYYDMCLG